MNFDRFINYKSPLMPYLFLVFVFFTPSIAMAGDNESGDWNHTAAIYLWMAGQSGTMAVKGVPAQVDVDFSDILDALDAGFLGHFETKKDEWAFGADVVYLKLGTTANYGTLGFTNVNVKAETTIAEFFAAYEFAPAWEVLGGVRYTSVSGDLGINNQILPKGLQFLGKKDWFDPFVGLRYITPINDKWSFRGRIDAGGFGVNSDMVWSASALFGYQFSDTGTAYIGYKVLDYDYADGAGNNRFVYDVSMQGPLLGVAFDF